MTAVIVVGAGFAGLWAALGAARRLDELAVPAGTVDITVFSAKPFHDVRVRNYEADLSACRIPLADLLDPVGVAHVATEVTAIDAGARTVTTSGGGIRLRPAGAGIRQPRGQTGHTGPAGVRF